MVEMDKIVSLCKRRGFIFQSSEIYGGTGSCWDYGPLGVELKNNVKRVWWRDSVHSRADMVGLGCVDPDASARVAGERPSRSLHRSDGRLPGFATGAFVPTNREDVWVHFCEATKGKSSIFRRRSVQTLRQKDALPACGKGELTEPRHVQFDVQDFYGAGGG